MVDYFFIDMNEDFWMGFWYGGHGYAVLYGYGTQISEMCI